MTTDPFRTAELRSAVLSAWERSPARFREDANTEEDHATGYYRDRVVVELAQNAADAAARAGVPGRLAMWLLDDGRTARLVAANTGAGIDAEGVASLASLRASAKSSPVAQAQVQAQTVGRFGVGFAAVRSVSDEVTVASRDGGVRFSLAETAAALAGRGVLTEHVTARADAVPILRLPFPAPALSAPAPDVTGGNAFPDVRSVGGLDLGTFDTVVILELRDAAAVAAVRSQLAAVDDTLVLALGALESVLVGDGPDVREVRDVQARWFTVTRSGVVPERVLADRPVEERARTSWTVTWAVPRSTTEIGDVTANQVVRAPTPTDEPLSVPAVLIASFPLDPSRRHVAQGPLTDFLVGEAGAAYADLAGLVPEPLDLVPTGLPRGRLDGALCEAVEAALLDTPVVGGRLARDTVVIEDEVSPALVTALEPTGLGVVQLDRRRRSAARRLGARTMSLADVLDALPDALTPAQWHTIYAALATIEAGPALREALTALLVPLADGGTARGPRGLVMGAASRAGRIEGVHRVHPEAAHPLLLRLGAVADDDPSVLGLAAVEQAARRLSEELVDEDIEAIRPEELEDLSALYELVAGVVRTNRMDPQSGPDWLADLPLPSDEGVWQRATELSWPGSWADEHLELAAVDPAGLATVDRPVSELVTAEVAAVAGVRSSLVVRTVAHETGEIDEDDDRPGWADYDDYLCAVIGERQSVDQMMVVEDLDVVADDSWTAVLDRAASDPDLRRAILDPVRVVGAEALSYAAWYLRDLFGAPWAGGASPMTSSEVDLRLVLRPAPPELDDLDDVDLARALGGVSTVDDLERVLTTTDAGIWHGFFDGLRHSSGDGDALGRAVPLVLAHSVWTALEDACRAGLELDPVPELIIALHGLGARITAAEEALVTSDPMWAQVRAVIPVVAAEEVESVANALDCAVANRSAVHLSGGLDPQATATEHVVPSWISRLVPGVPGSWTEHTDLTVDGRDVDWWVGPDADVHLRAGAPVSALARACAQAAGRWGQRHVVELALLDGTRRAELLADGAWDAPVTGQEPPVSRG